MLKKKKKKNSILNGEEAQLFKNDSFVYEVIGNDANDCINKLKDIAMEELDYINKYYNYKGTLKELNKEDLINIINNKF